VKALRTGLAVLLAVCAVLQYLYGYLCDIEANQAAKGVTASYDALVDLLDSIEHFLRRLDIYTRIPSTPAMDEIVIKIIVELLSTLGLATRELKQGRSSKPVCAALIPY
jgi:hypothetical protein